MTMQQLGRVVAVATALMVAVGTVAPPRADAMMRVGNYDLLTNRYTQASWVWFVTNCFPAKEPDCVHVSARPRLKFYAYYEGFARLVEGRYTMSIDVPDGLRCPGHNMPTQETYTWDELSLTGTIEARFDVGCFNGPPGVQSWTFALQRL